jgi:glyoxylase-like metal-dependent hydrolase (beta-lactamase superfamily II)
MRKLVTAIAVAAVFVSLTSLRAQDSKATLDAAAKALGDVSSIQFSGTGTTNSYGQSFKPDEPWPAFKTTSYTVTVDYKIPAMRMELQRTNPDVKVVRGGGGLPLLAPQTQNQVVSGKVAWNVAAPAAGGAPAAAPAMAAVNDRLLAIWAGGSAGAAAWVSAPQGDIRAAQANNASVAGRVVTFTANGSSVKATLNAANLVEKVETKADAAVLGDVVVETTYTNYRDFAGVKFPTRIAQKEGGFPMLDLTITDVKANINAAIAVPQNVVQQAAGQPADTAPVRVQTDKVADGVYYLTGGSHHSLAVEFNDHVVVFEAPQTDERAMAVLDATRKAIPNKPIRYVVNSHNHFDHLGGVRAIMAEGITIITQAGNKAYYEKVATMPHAIVPDRLSRSPKKPVIETVAEKRVLTDGNQILELYHVPTVHTGTMLVGYLPKAKILIEADLWNPPAANAPAQTAVNPVTTAFFDSIQALKLDVSQVAGLHGRLAPVKEFQTAAGKATH